MLGAAPDALAEIRLRTLVANASGARQLAAAHTIWAISRLDDIGPGGSSAVVEIAGTYTRTGAGVSTRAAYEARADVVGCLGQLLPATEAATVGATLPERQSGRWGNLLVLGLPELAAARSVARWCIDTGAMVEPVIALQDTPTDLLLPGQPKSRGKCRCPCGGHKHDDADPSAVYDLDRRRLSCLATGGRWSLQQEGAGWRLLTASLRTPAEEAGNNTYPQVSTASPWPHSGRSLLGSLGPAMTWKPSKRSWHELFRRADERGNREDVTAEAWARAWEGEIAAADGRDVTRQHEDRLIAIDAYKLVWGDRWGRRCPVGKEVLGTGRVLFDLDGLDPALLSESEWTALGEQLDEVVRASELFANVEFLTETSSTGVQVIARLRGFHWGSAEFHRSPSVRAELRRVGEAVRQIVGRGGVVDESAFAPGRWARLPGVRVKGGAVEHARLRWTGAERAVDNLVCLDAVRARVAKS